MLTVKSTGGCAAAPGCWSAPSEDIGASMLISEVEPSLDLPVEVVPMEELNAS